MNIRSLINFAFSMFFGSKNPISVWKTYADYFDISSSTIIDSVASVKIFNLPKKPKKILKIGEYSHIFANFNLVRSSAQIKIGKRCQIGNVNFNCAEKIEIGDDVLMAWGITVIDHDSHSLFWSERKNDASQCYQDYLADRNNFIRNKDWSHVKSKPIIIGNKAWIGFNATILKGVLIGEEAVVGACSVVTKNVPARSVVVGNPARIVKNLK